MASTARKLKRGSLIKEHIVLGSQVFLVIKRKVKGGNGKLTKARRKHPRSNLLVVASTALLPENGSNMPQQTPGGI